MDLENKVRMKNMDAKIRKIEKGSQKTTKELKELEKMDKVQDKKIAKCKGMKKKMK